MDPQGNRILLVDPDSVRTVYDYDELNRLETLTFGDGQQVAYEYFPDGLKKTVTNPNGTVSTYTYDAADRMTDISHVGPTGVVSSYRYDFDPNSNRERQVEQNAGRTETTDYTYDFVNRLKTVTYPDKAVAYQYDLSGNRIQEVTTGAEASDKTFDYDAINRLERITDNLGDEDVVYSYDANGNTTSKTAGGVTTNFFFDIRDQLGEVRQGPNILGRYGYDYDGRRILKIGDDGRRQYTYDQLSVITEADQVNNTVSKYDYGMDQLVRLDNRNEGRSFFHLDFLGSTVGLTDAAGGSRQSIFYDAWGNERDRIGSSANNFTFTGHELDEETGLIYAKARFYDPEVGRFLTQDHLLGDPSNAPSLHRYAYSWNRPLFFTDPDGHEVLPVGCYLGGECVTPPEERSQQIQSEETHLSDAAARSLGSLWATAKTFVRGGIGFLEDASKLIHYGARGRGDVIVEGAERRAEDVVEFVEMLPERQAQALEKAEERLLRDDHFGAGDVYTEEFVAPTATAAVTVLEGSVRVTRFARSKISAGQSVGELTEATATESAALDVAVLEEKALSTVTGKELTLSEYARLRRQTPSRAMRQLVNPEDARKVDPVYGYPVTRFEADHIVSMKEISKMPGFAELSPTARREVLNIPENAIGLGKPTNASKGARSWESWRGHSRLGPVPPQVRSQMLEAEAAARAALERAISERQGR